jgi:hypothetical protein
MVVRASNGMPVLDKDNTRSPVVRRDVLISNVICNWSAHNPSVILLQHPTYEEQSARARSASLRNQLQHWVEQAELHEPQTSLLGC